MVAAVLAAGLVSAVVVEGGAGVAPLIPSGAGNVPTITDASAPSVVADSSPARARDVSAYRGLGAWVDAFDYAPAYYRAREGPQVTLENLGVMAAEGVQTLYLQAARRDDLSPEGIVDRALVGSFLVAAHAAGMRVVAWYLPKFGDLEADLANLALLRDFRADGHRFDGIAVDIEYRRDVPDHAERNRRLLELSRRLRNEVGERALGAIVYPPVLFDEIRPDFWPDFPWKELAQSFDVWLPMAYWTEIAAESSYGDGYRYTEVGTRQLLGKLDDPSALVHAVGGVADTSTVDDYEGFLRAVDETGALGFSMYDYRTTSPAGWRLLAARAPGST